MQIQLHHDALEPTWQQLNYSLDVCRATQGVHVEIDTEIKNSTV